MGTHLPLEIVTMIPGVITVLKCFVEHGGTKDATMPISMANICVLDQMVEMIADSPGMMAVRDSTTLRYR